MIDHGQMTVELACAAFGLTPAAGASISGPSRGAAGQIWCLDLGSAKYAVKELFSGWDEEPVRTEVTFTTHLQAAGIRLPGSVPSASTGQFLVPVTADTEDRWLRLYQWIDGVPAELADPRTANQVGDLLARLHMNALPPQGAPDLWFEAVPDPVTWHQLADAARVQGASWGQELAGRTGQLTELAGLVTPADWDQQVTCHRDLHPDNVLVDQSGALVALDWDDVGPACPDRELAAVLAFWHLDGAGRADEEAFKRTLAAYYAAGGPGRLHDEQAFGMYIAGRLNFLHAQAGLALDDDASSENRQYAADEISDTLARLPTPPLISYLIELAAL
jgi:Ser/Thr protein kinase RdoA (MazF antagonist)